MKLHHLANATDLNNPRTLFRNTVPDRAYVQPVKATTWQEIAREGCTGTLFPKAALNTVPEHPTRTLYRYTLLEHCSTCFSVTLPTTNIGKGLNLEFLLHTPWSAAQSTGNLGPINLPGNDLFSEDTTEISTDAFNEALSEALSVE